MTVRVITQGSPEFLLRVLVAQFRYMIERDGKRHDLEVDATHYDEAGETRVYIKGRGFEPIEASIPYGTTEQQMTELGRALWRQTGPGQEWLRIVGSSEIYD